MYEAEGVAIRDSTLEQLLRGLAKIIVPLAIAAVYIGWVSSLGDVGNILLPLLAAYFFPPMGKESVIPLGVSLGVHPALMAVSVAIIDILVGLFLLWNYPMLYRVPILGKWAKKTEVKARKMIEEGRGFSKIAFLGLVLWVIVPFQGSGALSATIIGKMSGMDEKKVWLAIILGALAGTFMVAYSFNLIITAFRSDLLLGIIIVAAIAAVVAILYYRTRRVHDGEDPSFQQIKDFSILATNGGVVVEGSPESPAQHSFLEEGR